MKPTLEFTLANDIYTSKSNNASASIVINNGPIQSPGDPSAEIVYPSIPTMYIPAQAEFTIKFYIKLAEITTKILKSNNPTLLANLIDQSGKVILRAVDLVELIGLMTNIPKENIIIQYCDDSDDATCCAVLNEKYNPLKDIQAILINNFDFKMQHNREFNILKTSFNISLSRCLVTI